MQINHHMSSPNMDAVEIPVEFAVLHYTAAPLNETLRIFKDPQSKVSAHLVIGENGEVYEIVKCLEGKAQRAWHAGESRWQDGDRLWQGFNDFSLGIELVNLNGNLFPYSQRQYEALRELIALLKTFYPALRSPSRLLGHEQIAAWRGKCDPGWKFDWGGFFQKTYPGEDMPLRTAALPEDVRLGMDKFLAAVCASDRQNSRLWTALNAMLEAALKAKPE